jgi:diguanylate cyclase (GGDEF)-like protein/PAS domain S-box-containing protein
MKLVELIAENSPDLLSLEDGKDRYVYVSASAQRLLGWRHEELQGTSITALYHAEDAERIERERAELRRGTLSSICCRYRLRVRSGSYRWVESRSRLCDPVPEYVATTTRVVHELKTLEWRATYDSLTGLLNRDATERALDAEFSRGRRQGEILSVAFFDVDGLKRINDTGGHLVGDALLRSLSYCVTRCKRPYDMLGRWGGDEFILILPGTDTEDATAILERIRQSVARELPGTTVSFGVSSSANTPSVRALLTDADRALYEGKRRGGNEVVAGNRA